jgi:hypothetical protein
MDQWKARFQKTIRVSDAESVDMYWLRTAHGRRVSLGVPHGDTETPAFVEAALRAAEMKKQTRQ